MFSFPIRRRECSLVNLPDVFLEVVLRVEFLAALVAIVPKAHLGLVLAHPLLPQMALDVPHELGPLPEQCCERSICVPTLIFFRNIISKNSIECE